MTFPFVCVDNKARADAKAAMTVATSGSNAAVAAQATANEALKQQQCPRMAFTCARYDANNFYATWDISAVPANLQGFVIYARSDGAAYRPVTSFDANERASTFGNPAYTNVIEMYIGAVDSGRVPITMPSQVVTFTNP